MAAVILVVVSMFDVTTVRRSAFFIWLVAIGIMLALPILGHNAKGATRWVEIGGFTLQPSEFMKPALIILVAWMFAEGQKGQGVPGVSIAFALYFISIALLLIQPDIGQTVLITVAFGAAFWMAGVPISWVMGLGVTAIRGLVVHPISCSRTWPAGSTGSCRRTRPTPIRWTPPRWPRRPAACSGLEGPAKGC